MAGSGEELIIKNVSIVEKRDGLFWHQQRMKPIRSYSLYFDTDYGGDIDEKFLGDNIFSLLFVNSPIEKFLREGASFPDSVLKEIKKERGWVDLAVGVTNGNPWIKLYSWRAEYGALFDVE